jgi:ubiquinone/menaquinone biosynthesis C-methylase UbiE
VDHNDHVRLLRDGIPVRGGTWADIGAGTGAFTLALADLLGPDGSIYAVDRDIRALRANARAMEEWFPEVTVSHLAADFTGSLELPALDGIVMANALHFAREQEATVRRLRSHLKPGGRFVVVEYNLDRANSAVPYPVPFSRWEAIARTAGFGHAELLYRRPSRFLREIYSAASWDSTP